MPRSLLQVELGMVGWLCDLRQLMIDLRIMFYLLFLKMNLSEQPLQPYD